MEPIPQRIQTEVGKNETLAILIKYFSSASRIAASSRSQNSATICASSIRHSPSPQCFSLIYYTTDSTAWVTFFMELPENGAPIVMVLCYHDKCGQKQKRMQGAKNRIRGASASDSVFCTICRVPLRTETDGQASSGSSSQTNTALSCRSMSWGRKLAAMLRLALPASIGAAHSATSIMVLDRKLR